MLENVLSHGELSRVARYRHHEYESASVRHSQVDEYLNNGWAEEKRFKTRTRLRRDKDRATLLEDRVWSFLYQTGFEYISGDGDATLVHTTADGNTLDNQLDCVALDSDVAIAFECKSFSKPKRDSSFHEKLAKFSSVREEFFKSVSSQWPQPERRVFGHVMVIWDLVIGPRDRSRAKELGITILEERDLQYFEGMVRQLGSAARYQFLRTIFHGRPIPGLKIRLPALQSRVGRVTTYTFSIEPEHLLKFAYVSHRALGSSSQGVAYQRMVKKSRLAKLRRYIDQEGVFPTNIVLNLEKSRHTRFDVSKIGEDTAGAKPGFLTIQPAYRSAWVIDGQHRLFAFSGHERARTSQLSVLAFEGLSESKQASFFVDINHEQKSVPRGLLDELSAELFWDSEDCNLRLRAVLSKVIQDLNDETGSPFRDRLRLGEQSRTARRCISVTSLLKPLATSSLYLRTVRPRVVDSGPLWADANEFTAERTKRVLIAWFGTISDAASEWWNLGQGPGGGLAMNDSVSACLLVLASTIEYLDSQQSLKALDDTQLVAAIVPYAETLGLALSEYSEAERLDFRKQRGVQGQTQRARMMEEILRNHHDGYTSQRLEQYLEARSTNLNQEAYGAIDRIQPRLQELVVDTLKSVYGENVNQWFGQGVPVNVRTKISNRIAASDRPDYESPERSMDIVDYRNIIEAKNNWHRFEKFLSQGEGNKANRTKWLQKFNQIRIAVMHPDRGEVVNREQLEWLESISDWLLKIDINLMLCDSS